MNLQVGEVRPSPAASNPQLFNVGEPVVNDIFNACNILLYRFDYTILFYLILILRRFSCSVFSPYKIQYIPYESIYVFQNFKTCASSFKKKKKPILRDRE